MVGETPPIEGQTEEGEEVIEEGEEIEEEEYEYYDFELVPRKEVEKPVTKPKIIKPKEPATSKAKVTKSTDKCPFCEHEEIGLLKDEGIYFCYKCGRGWVNE